MVFFLMNFLPMLVEIKKLSFRIVIFFVSYKIFLLDFCFFIVYYFLVKVRNNLDLANMKGVDILLCSPSLTVRQTLQGMSHEVSTIRRELFELSLYDTPLLASTHYIDAMKYLHEAALELSHLRVVASPDTVSSLAAALPDLDSVLSRI